MLDLHAEDGELDLSAIVTDMRPYRGQDSMRRQSDAVAGANCDTTYAGRDLGGWDFGCLPAHVGSGNEAEIAARLRRRGLDYARNHLGRVPVVIAARILRPWGVFRPGEQIAQRVSGEGQRRRVDWIGLACFWALVPLAIAGAALLRGRGQPLFILLAPFVLVVLVSATGYGVLRFRTPADPVVIALAAVALDALLRRWRPAVVASGRL